MKTSGVIRFILASLSALFITLTSLPAAAQNKLADADNAFAFNLLQQISKEEPGQNIFISPFSAASALQMVANGAEGETLAEMQNVLNTTGMAQNDLNADCKELNDSLEAQTNVVLDLANSIWCRSNLELMPAYVSRNQNYFQAELAPANFADPKTADTINHWAEKATRGKMQKIVQFPFPPATALVIANAIYFKGEWEDPFNKYWTMPRDFHQANGTVNQVPMMSKRKRFSYQEGDGFQAVELPYAGDRLQMVLFLPATNSSPQQLLANFSGQAWRDKVLSAFSGYEGELMFPKFKLNYAVSLNKSLQALGMHESFVNGAADFLAMANDPDLAISEVTQNSYVAVDEEGTEAAAVTTVTMTDALAMPPPENFRMVVDRPFFFVITDKQTQAILFMGIVNDPAS